MEVFIIVTVLWIFSVCIHEFGHAWVAHKGGDYTVRDKGYLTLNPIHYTHPVYSLLLPVVFMIMGGIGLPGGAVYIERHLLKSRAWETWVSLAGPATNVIMVLIISLCFKTGLVPPGHDHLSSVALGLLMQLEVSAIVLNLLPIPPLDGFQAIAPWLPPDIRERAYAVSNQALWILFLALFFVKPLNHGFWFIVDGITAALGVPLDLPYYGWHSFRFWEHNTL